MAYFLAFDGLDGSGKTTLARAFVAWLRSLGQPVTTCVDPGGTALGGQLRSILLEHRDQPISWRAETLLFMTSRAQLVEEVIRPALDRGEIVVTDRYLLATIVYQGHAGGVPIAELRQLGQFATGGIVPDQYILLDVPVPVAIHRRQQGRGTGADRIEARGTEYAEKVRQGFLAEARADPQTIFVLNAEKSQSELLAELQEQLAPALRLRGYAV
ncbi:MAG: dTMP kinase [Gemmataceae bacterium]